MVDKDRVASLLGEQLNADLLIISTGVSNVALNFGKSNQIDLDSVTTEAAKLYLEEGYFAAGSMGPKIEAAVSYLEAGGSEVIITLPEMIEQSVLGDEGTHIYAQVDKKKSLAVG